MSVSIGTVVPGRKALAAKWSAAALLALAAGVLLWLVGSGAAQEGGPAAPGAARAASSAGGGILVVAGQVTSDSYGLYLVDYQSSTICVYEYLPGDRRLRLMAARNYGYDLQLEDYNNEQDTAPARIRELVRQQRPIGAATQPN